MSKNISYGKQEITEADIAAVISALKADYLTQGPLVSEFENEFAKFVGAQHAVAVTNATAALHIACLALGLKEKQKIITSPITFVASANCALYSGADVSFVDIDTSNYCLDLNKTEDLLKKSPAGTFAGLIPVDFAGYPINASDYKTLANKYKLWIIEDACHAPGAEFQTADGAWKKTGSGEFSDLSIFSFHPVKHIATGEGGMITTNSAALADRLRKLRSHGIVREPELFKNKISGGWYHEMQTLGFNYRMPDFNCALGLSQLKRIESNLKRRRAIADTYNTELKNLPLTLPQTNHKVKHAYHLYVIQTTKREALYNYLKEHHIYSQVHYIPVHTQPYYVEKYGAQSLPVAEAYYSQCLSLPMYHSLSEEDQAYVIEKIKNFF